MIGSSPEGRLDCPQCGKPLPSDAKTCPNCGVDLALVALLAERAYLDGLPEQAPLPPTSGTAVPRIGEYLLDQGIISPEQLQRALDRQEQLANLGQQQLLGQTLIKMGLVDRETLDRAITDQIIELHAAIQEANRTLERRVEERTAELRRALERLTELNRIKANFVSNVSHELRTPLAHIKGYIELFTDEQLGPLSEEQLDALNVVHRATGRLERLIEDLIEFSTASRKGLRIHPEPIDLRDLAESVLNQSAEKAEKAGVKVELNLDSDMPALEADPERLSWVLYQLVDNGIKFTAPGGTVRLEARNADGRVEVTVTDSGIGIAEDRLDEIFEPFHQLDGSPTRRYGGTGLGLALVRLILDAHGQDMTVQSREGQGSRFQFSLPAARGQA